MWSANVKGDDILTGFTGYLLTHSFRSTPYKIAPHLNYHSKMQSPLTNT